MRTTKVSGGRRLEPATCFIAEASQPPATRVPTRSKLARTSSAVSTRPLWKRTPGRILNV